MLSPEVHATALTAHPSPEAFDIDAFRGTRVEVAAKIQEQVGERLLESAGANGVVKPAASREAHAIAYQEVTRKYQLPAHSSELH